MEIITCGEIEHLFTREAEGEIVHLFTRGGEGEIELAEQRER